MKLAAVMLCAAITPLVYIVLKSSNGLGVLAILCEPLVELMCHACAHMCTPNIDKRNRCNLLLAGDMHILQSNVLGIAPKHSETLTIGWCQHLL